MRRVRLPETARGFPGAACAAGRRRAQAARSESPAASHRAAAWRNHSAKSGSPLAQVGAQLGFERRLDLVEQPAGGARGPRAEGEPGAMQGERLGEVGAPGGGPGKAASAAAESPE